jgi:hypothetical protein
LFVETSFTLGFAKTTDNICQNFLFGISEAEQATNIINKTSICNGDDSKIKEKKYFVISRENVDLEKYVTFKPNINLALYYFSAAFNKSFIRNPFTFYLFFYRFQFPQTILIEFQVLNIHE